MAASQRCKQENFKVSLNADFVLLIRGIYNLSRLVNCHNLYFT